MDGSCGRGPGDPSSNGAAGRPRGGAQGAVQGDQDGGEGDSAPPALPNEPAWPREVVKPFFFLFNQTNTNFFFRTKKI